MFKQLQIGGFASRKTLMVGVLALVFVAVVGYRISELFESPPDVGKRPKKAGNSTSRKVAEDALTQASPVRQNRKWPALKLAEIIRHDPFASAPQNLPTVAAQGALDLEASVSRQDEEERKRAQQETLQTLRSKGVSMVMHGPSGPAAAIGDRLVHLGDTLGAFRVAEIDAQGVVLEPVRRNDK